MAAVGTDPRNEATRISQATCSRQDGVGRSRGSALLVLALAVIACAPLPAVIPPAAEALPSVGSDPVLAGIARDLLAAANRARAVEGLSPLQPDPALDRAAAEHAQELAGRGVLDHRSRTPGRETLTRRIEAAGGTWFQAGENLARLGGPGAEAGHHIVQLWLASPAHRRNLMDRTYTHAGSGIAIASRGEWVAVQLYVLPTAPARPR
jgi:uncharacterized protein YkwD